MTKLKEAIAAIKAGDTNTGQALLRQVLQETPQNETAWLWMAVVANDSAQKKKYLQHVLEINPDNMTAREGLDRLEISETTEEAPTAEEIVPKLYPEKSAPKLKSLSSSRSKDYIEPENTNPIQREPSSQPTWTSSEIFGLTVMGIFIIFSLFVIRFGNPLQGLGFLALGLFLSVSGVEQQKRRRGENISSIRATRIVVGIITLIISLINLILFLRF
jgi:hypothetical protein